MDKKNRYKKFEGYILFIVIIITVILVSVTATVTILTISHSGDIVKDTNRNKAYYIANSGLEIVYSALNETHIIENAGTGDFDSEKNKILEKKNMIIKNQYGNVLGYADVLVDLKKIPAPIERWYYRIVSNGKIGTSDDNNTPSDTHVLTMFIFKDDINNPKIYEGDKQTP